ncbi:spore germination protein [Metabacillus halosaccharovorans]|uniref:Spore germination protein n=1 Tax=Metabacillus halosaccharovorans TaxID=930124 RepID=A0ABT3DIK4_9BACI|nr:spore germination protein [Metabacillus halosaccharovorans]MBU7595484.1 spore germination protein [Metabacillus halosaccharovorans]MCV9886885.1 spore germination protein [Metabacillus halosaccharovorans]
MPAFVGPIELNSIDSSAVFKVGDTFSLSPKSSDKTSLGSGVANTGDFTNTQNVFNITNFEDSDVIDQTNIFNF